MPPKACRAARGTKMTCKGWAQEAALRMLNNNLDAEVARRGEVFAVTTTYERTTVWGPAHSTVVGSRTARIVREWEVTRDGTLTAREIRETELRTSPP